MAHRSFREVREEAELSRTEAAGRLGVSYEWLRQVEAGKSIPTVELLRLMASTYPLDRMQEDRAMLAALRMRRKLPKMVEYDKLRRAIQDQRLGGLASSVTGEVMRAVDECGKLSSRQLHAEIKDAVEYFLSGWEFR
jgi:transcriptional regulator with XRE-family HTH domain